MASDPEREESTVFAPLFNRDGLIAVVTTDAGTGKVLMQAWMNREALDKTLETGKVHYWSRSRQELWLKGGTSGDIQDVVEILTDCDQDSLWVKVNQRGKGACHTGRRSCFYRRVLPDGTLDFSHE